MTEQLAARRQAAGPATGPNGAPLEVRSRVWRSETWRHGRVTSLLFGAVLCGPSGLVLMAMSQDEGPTGAALLVAGLFFVGVGILLGRIGREPYALRMDPSRRRLWVTRGAREAEEASSATVVGFAVSEQARRAFSSFTIALAVVSTQRQLCYRKMGNPHLWPVPASTFATRQEAQHVLAGALCLLESAP